MLVPYNFRPHAPGFDEVEVREVAWDRGLAFMGSQVHAQLLCN